MSELLNIKNLTVSVVSSGVKLVNQINLQVANNSITALVGGSGSGKTTTGLSILRLLPEALSIDSGEVLFEGKNVFSLSEDQLLNLRGGRIGMVFQEPLNAFNPVFTIGEQVKEVLTFHTTLSGNKCQQRVFELLDLVGIKEPKRTANDYPHQLSGGMRQRAMIAQAIAADPKLIIADEPTSNLDVTLQAKIIELFNDLRKKLDLSILLISHDIEMVSHIADSVAVMTEGDLVEQGKTEDLLSHPKTDYTKKLLGALG